MYTFIICFIHTPPSSGCCSRVRLNSVREKMEPPMYVFFFDFSRFRLNVIYSQNPKEETLQEP